jgi:uncharacterized damage-inducible protein DinB
MILSEILSNEFAHEAKTTRRMLERLPAGKLDWRPHAKSFTTIGLASHIVECLDLIGAILNEDGFDFDPATYQRCKAASIDVLLQNFDERVARGQSAFATVTDTDLMRLWSFKVMGREWWQKPKAVALRDFTISHLIHHRGQLSVYLRLLDVPVPGAYGPTADDKR